MTQPRNQFLDEEAQMEALRRKIEQQGNDEYQLPAETRIIHEGRPLPAQEQRYADAPPAFIGSQNTSRNDNATIIPEPSDYARPATDVLMSPPPQVLRQHEPTIPGHDNIKEQIRALEEKLGEHGPSSLPDETTFSDSAGNETYYVKNITNRHISISGLGPEDGGG